MATPTTPTTELEAVNTILATIGEAPLTTLTGSLPASSAIAYNTLKETARAAQTYGFTFNSELHYTLARDGSNEIVLPTNCIRVEIARGKYYPSEPVIRGTKMYDRYSHTTVWNKDLVAERLVILLDFTDLPEACRRYILIRSARIFQDRVLGSDSVHAYSKEEELAAWQTLLCDYTDTFRPNAGWAVANILQRGRTW